MVWIAFPFLVNSKFNELMRHQMSTILWLKKISEQIEAAGRGTQAPPTLETKKEAAAPPPVPPGVYKLD